MSESTNATPQSDVYALPDGLFKFVDTDGKPYSLDLIDCHIKQNEIVDQAVQHQDQEYWYLVAFRDWLKTQAIPAEGKTLRLGEVDQLWHRLRLAHAEAKKKQKEELEEMQNSLTSSVSAPAA